MLEFQPNMTKYGDNYSYDYRPDGRGWVQIKPTIFFLFFHPTVFWVIKVFKVTVISKCYCENSSKYKVGFQFDLRLEVYHLACFSWVFFVFLKITLYMIFNINGTCLMRLDSQFSLSEEEYFFLILFDLQFIWLNTSYRFHFI